MEINWTRTHPLAHRFLQSIVHAVGLLNCATATIEHFYYQFLIKERQSMLNNFKYYSIWTIILLTFYYFLCCIVDFFHPILTNITVNQIIKLKDYIGCSLAFPSTVVVCFVFWSLSAIDVNLVVTTEDLEIPLFLTHKLHTNTLFLQIADFLCCSKKYQTGAKGILGTIIIGCTYMMWVQLIHMFTGEYVYPLFAKISLIERFGIMAVITLIFIVAYYFGQLMNRVLWESDDSGCNTLSASDAKPART